MIGWGLGDNNAGQVAPSSDVDGGAAGVNRNVYAVLKGTGIQTVDSSADVFMSFTLHDSGVTGLLRYMGSEWTFDWSQTLARTSALALVLGQDNDSGERYQVNTLQVADGQTVPEPTMLQLFALGIVGLLVLRGRATEGRLRGAVDSRCSGRHGLAGT